jgi:hypothetical protein
LLLLLPGYWRLRRFWMWLLLLLRWLLLLLGQVVVQETPGTLCGRKGVHGHSCSGGLNDDA